MVRSLASGRFEIKEEDLAAQYDLRPLSLGEILDRVFTLYRTHFALFVGVMAIPAVVKIPTNLYSFSIWGKMLGPEAGHAPPFDPGILGVIYLVIFPVILVVGTLGMGAISLAVSDVYLGRAATIRGSYRRALQRFWRLLGLLFSVGVILMGIVIVFAIGMGLFMATFAASRAVGNLGNGARIAVVLLFLLVILAILAAAIFVGMIFSLGIPALLLEDATVGGALRRSIELTRHRRWHIFLGVLLTVFVSYSVILIFEGPFMLAMGMFMLQGGAPPGWLAFATSISAACGSAVSSPLIMIALVLYYYDQRVRKEAFDLQHMIAQIDAAPQKAPPGFVPS
jgi:hypothetical protein